MKSFLIVAALLAALTTASANPGTTFSGDVDCSIHLDINDAIVLSNWLAGGPEPCCPGVADTNDDGSVNGADVSYLLNYLFSGGPEPVGPIDVCVN
jgi:hypothetical protein